eukprot:5843607-Prymnesium_polylepis.1
MPVGRKFPGRQVTRSPRGAATAWGHGATGDMKWVTRFFVSDQTKTTKRKPLNPRHTCFYMWVPRVGTCRALQEYDIRARGTDPRPNTPLPVG